MRISTNTNSCTLCLLKVTLSCHQQIQMIADNGENIRIKYHSNNTGYRPHDHLTCPFSSCLSLNFGSFIATIDASASFLIPVLWSLFLSSLELFVRSYIHPRGGGISSTIAATYHPPLSVTIGRKMSRSSHHKTRLISNKMICSNIYISFVSYWTCLPINRISLSACNSFYLELRIEHIIILATLLFYKVPNFPDFLPLNKLLTRIYYPL